VTYKNKNIAEGPRRAPVVALLMVIL